MKSIKLFGLATLTALMAMAFVGASSAIAEYTQLCKVDESLCQPGNVITHVHEVSVGEDVLLTSAGNILCLALFLGDTSGLGAPLEINGHFTFGSSGHSCVRHKIFGGTENCTVTDVGTLGTTLLILRLGHESGDVYGRGGLGEIRVTCGSAIDCEYLLAQVFGAIHGPLLSIQLNGEVTISKKTLANWGGFFCPAKNELDLTTTPLELVYLSE
jgi:hypothetical protein